MRDVCDQRRPQLHRFRFFAQPTHRQPRADAGDEQRDEACDETDETMVLPSGTDVRGPYRCAHPVRAERRRERRDECESVRDVDASRLRRRWDEGDVGLLLNLEIVAGHAERLTNHAAHTRQKPRRIVCVTHRAARCVELARQAFFLPRFRAISRM